MHHWIRISPGFHLIRDGLNEVTFQVRGEDAWQRLHHEGGTHRVQRVPVTESQGRIHTSAATVTVLPEAEEADMGYLLDERVDRVPHGAEIGRGRERDPRRRARQDDGDRVAERLVLLVGERAELLHLAEDHDAAPVRR